MSFKKKWNDACEFCGNADDECTMCHDTFERAEADCPHGEGHATWYYPWADHEANTLTLKYDCGLCGGNVTASVEPLSVSQRLWNNLCKAARDCSIDITSRASTDWLCRAVTHARELGLFREEAQP